VEIGEGYLLFGYTLATYGEKRTIGNVKTKVLNHEIHEKHETEVQKPNCLTT
jgi:hypothetical protein